jgi:hypothetical protein
MKAVRRAPSTTTQLRWCHTLLRFSVILLATGVLMAWQLRGLHAALKVFMAGCVILCLPMMWRSSLRRVLEQRRKPVLTPWSVKPWKTNGAKQDRSAPG